MSKACELTAGPPSPGAMDVAKSSPTHVSRRTRPPSEASDDYPAIVAVLDAKTRVIAADIQWIIQRPRGRVWGSQYFCRTKMGLLFYAKPITSELLALPDRFQEHDDSWQDRPAQEDAPPAVPVIEGAANV